jgi:RNA polymerase sigma factor (sigma-70 family)
MAALRFDPSSGWRFSTYAYPYIAGRILDWLRKERRHQEVRGLRASASKRARDFAAETPDQFEVSGNEDDTNRGHLKTYAERLIAAMAAGVSAAPPDPEESEMHRLTVIAVRDAFATMSEAERKIYRLHYGEDKTLKEIAKALGVASITARRWHESLLDKIAARLHAEGVTELCDARVVVSEGDDEGEG